MPTLLLLASLFATTSQSPARPAADSVQARLQRIADSVVAARPRMPGIIIAVEQPATGKRWSVAAGLADTARKIRLTPDQPVRLASNTKTYTAAAVRSLVRFDKLGLRHTWWEQLEPAPPGEPDRAHQYLGGLDAYGIDPSFDLYGGGGIVATMADLAHFLTALLAGQVLEKRETLEIMMRPRSPEMNGYGMGLFGSTVGGLTGRGHSGFWGTTAMVFPDAGVTIAVAITDQGESRQSNAVMGAVLKVLGAER